MFLVLVLLIANMIFQVKSPPPPAICNEDYAFCVGSTLDYPTIQRAIDAVTGPGDQIYIDGGTYTECLQINSTRPAGTLAQHIEIRPLDGEVVTIAQDIVCTSNRMIYLDRDFWKIHNGGGTLILAMGSASVSTCQLLHINNYGVYIGPLEITNSVLASGGYGIQNLRTVAHVFDGIKFTGPARFYQLDQRGNWYSGLGDPPYGKYKAVWVKNCHFKGGNIFGGSASMQVFADNLYMTVENNYFAVVAGNEQHIRLHDARHVIIQNNIIEGGRIFISRGSVAYYISDISIHNNLFYCATSNYSPFRAQFSGGIIYRVFITNNLFVGPCGNTADGIIYNQNPDFTHRFDSSKISHNVCEDGTVTFFSSTLYIDEMIDNRVGTETVNLREGGETKPWPYFETLNQIKGPYMNDATYIYKDSPSIDYAYNNRSMWGVTIGPVEVREDCSAVDNHWDASKWCYWCEEGYDILTDCTECLGNRDNETNCLTCINFYENIVDDCDTCYLVNQNVQCDDCINQYWRLSTNCSQCYGNRNDGNNCVTCKQYYDNLPGDCDQCLGNRNYSNQCLTCLKNFTNEPGNCDQCVLNRDYGDNCLSCKNYYYDLENDCPLCALDPYGINDCSMCINSYLDLTGDNCQSCTSILHDFNTNCTTCSASTKYIHPNCDTCIDHWNEGTDCATCDTSYHLTGSNTCDSGCDSNSYCLDNNCQEADWSICTDCDTDRYLNGNICDLCINDCATCTAADTCQSCDSTFHLTGNNTCDSGCDSNSYCLVDNCQEADWSICTDCDTDRYLNGGVCDLCINDCATCTDADNCQSCDSSFHLTGNNTCDSGCDSNSYCLVDNCQETDWSICTDCDTDRYLNGNVCDLCINDCATCTAADNCQSCDSSFHLTGSNTCDSGCDSNSYCLDNNCQEANWSICTDCDTDRYLNGNVCDLCINDCATCTAADNCQSCDSSFHLNINDNSCNAGCFIGSNCSDCQEADWTLCTACPSGRWLNGDSCDVCDTKCATCDGPSNTDCLTCADYWLGSNCDFCPFEDISDLCQLCVNGKGPDTNCTCDQYYAPPGCTLCIIPDQDENAGCLNCTNPKKIWPDCDTCENYWTDANCGTCPPLYNGNCDECSNPLFDKDDGCDSCLIDKMIYSDCDTCVDYWTSGDCSICPDNYEQTLCQECDSTHQKYNPIAGCAECLNTRQDKDDGCDSCLIDKMIYPDCDTCDDYWTSGDCSICPDDYEQTLCQQCDSTHQNYDPINGCVACINHYSLSSLCTECEEGYDIESNCVDAIEGGNTGLIIAITVPIIIVVVLLVLLILGGGTIFLVVKRRKKNFDDLNGELDVTLDVVSGGNEKEFEKMKKQAKNEEVKKTEDIKGKTADFGELKIPKRHKKLTKPKQTKPNPKPKSKPKPKPKKPVASNRPKNPTVPKTRKPTGKPKPKPVKKINETSSRIKDLEKQMEEKMKRLKELEKK